MTNNEFAKWMKLIQENIQLITDQMIANTKEIRIIKEQISDLERKIRGPTSAGPR